MNNNIPEEQNSRFGTIFFLMYILHMLLQKMKQILLKNILSPWLLQELFIKIVAAYLHRS